MSFHNIIRCEARFVDPVVYIIIGPCVSLIDLLLQTLRKKIHILILGGQGIIELGVEHADDLARFVADDLTLLDVVKSRHGETSLVLRVDFEIDLTKMREAFVDRIRSHIFAWSLFVWGNKVPPLFLHMPVYTGIRYEIFKPFEFTYNQSSMGLGVVSSTVYVVTEAHKTNPTDKRTRHKDDIDPSQGETRRLASLK